MGGCAQWDICPRIKFSLSWCWQAAALSLFFSLSIIFQPLPRWRERSVMLLSVCTCTMCVGLMHVHPSARRQSKTYKFSALSQIGILLIVCDVCAGCALYNKGIKARSMLWKIEAQCVQIILLWRKWQVVLAGFARAPQQTREGVSVYFIVVSGHDHFLDLNTQRLVGRRRVQIKRSRTIYHSQNWKIAAADVYLLPAPTFTVNIRSQICWLFALTPFVPIKYCI